MASDPLDPTHASVDDVRKFFGGRPAIAPKGKKAGGGYGGYGGASVDRTYDQTPDTTTPRRDDTREGGADSSSGGRGGYVRHTLVMKRREGCST